MDKKKTFREELDNTTSGLLPEAKWLEGTMPKMPSNLKGERMLTINDLDSIRLRAQRLVKKGLNQSKAVEVAKKDFIYDREWIKKTSKKKLEELKKKITIERLKGLPKNFRISIG